MNFLAMFTQDERDTIDDAFYMECLGSNITFMLANKLHSREGNEEYTIMEYLNAWQKQLLEYIDLADKPGDIGREKLDEMEILPKVAEKIYDIVSAFVLCALDDSYNLPEGTYDEIIKAEFRATVLIETGQINTAELHKYKDLARNGIMNWYTEQEGCFFIIDLHARMKKLGDVLGIIDDASSVEFLAEYMSKRVYLID